MIKEHPILFSTPMVKAILEGRKTQTRRLVKKAPTTEINHRLLKFDNGWNWQVDQQGIASTMHCEIDNPMQCSYGKVGDFLWVRETFGTKIRNVGGTPHESFAYKADNPDEIAYSDCNGEAYPVKWKPSIHMPRHACRLILEITNIRVERLHDISEADAVAEGMIADDDYCAEEYFSMLWNEINGWKEKGWNANPWVWCITFKVIEGGAA